MDMSVRPRTERTADMQSDHLIAQISRANVLRNV